jgi:hypothetical protein
MMHQKNRSYIIVEKDSINNIDFSKVLETSLSSLRYSIDKTKVIVKFDSDVLEGFEDKKQYTYSEINKVLNSLEWQEEVPFGMPDDPLNPNNNK